MGFGISMFLSVKVDRNKRLGRIAGYSSTLKCGRSGFRG